MSPATDVSHSSQSRPEQGSSGHRHLVCRKLEVLKQLLLVAVATLGHWLYRTQHVRGHSICGSAESGGCLVCTQSEGLWT